MRRKKMSHSFTQVGKGKMQSCKTVNHPTIAHVQEDSRRLRTENCATILPKSPRKSLYPTDLHLSVENCQVLLLMAILGWVINVENPKLLAPSTCWIFMVHVCLRECLPPQDLPPVLPHHAALPPVLCPKGPWALHMSRRRWFTMVQDGSIHQS